MGANGLARVRLPPHTKNTGSDSLLHRINAWPRQTSFFTFSVCSRCLILHPGRRHGSKPQNYQQVTDETGLNHCAQNLSESVFVAMSFKQKRVIA